MKIGSCFPSKYVKASDIPDGKKILVTIERVNQEDVGGNGAAEDFKPVLYFANKSKGFVLNKTNYSTICDALGTDESDVWEGTQILLYAAKTSFQGKMVPCIRVDMPTTQRAVPAQRPRTVVEVPPRPAPRKVEHDGEFADDSAGEFAVAVDQAPDDGIPF